MHVAILFSDLNKKVASFISFIHCMSKLKYQHFYTKNEQKKVPRLFSMKKKKWPHLFLEK